MSFLHRKLLHLSPHHDSPIPSPQQLPIATLPILFPDKPSSETHHHIHALQIAMIITTSIAGMVLLLFTISTTLRNYYSRRHNHNRRRNTPILFHVNGDSESPDDDDDDDVERVVDHAIWHIRTVGFEQRLIDSITVFKYRKDEGVIDHGTGCSVCLGEFEQDESLRLLPKCSHAFHIPCIDTWLRSHKNCPLCRAPVFNDDDEVSGETQNQEVQMENVEGVAVAAEFESIENDHDGDDDSVIISSTEIAGKILLPVRRSVSMDSSSSSASVILFDDVVESVRINLSSSSSKEVSGSISSGKFKRALQKKPVSMRRRSFSHNRKFLFSRHCRSQSLTLPL